MRKKKKTNKQNKIGDRKPGLLHGGVNREMPRRRMRKIWSIKANGKSTKKQKEENEASEEQKGIN